MDFDAIILAGGRSSRLGGSPKSALMFDGATLLERSLAAAAGARHTVVVGPAVAGLPPWVLTSREDPPFAGPAAAIAAGLAALRGAGPADKVLVLACDMPGVGAAVRALREALPGSGADGVLAASADGRLQPLVGFYGTAVLERAVQEAAARNALVHGSVFALLASLDVQAVAVPAGSTDDVDTWDDAAALGVAVREQ
ncbi:molybdenum cofactor guanylyltransferase [Arthrobacter sp. QXT-31]|uniref:molybdenum cofactor guanylyltransferase n=1 Tax=Arthrobacter sp. QXT-31 TaxID=1357915 RepID=UPI00097196D0|nr:NTP transferase domain-containing protein [Arthrobacter sp. QXT-31]APX01340.1 molybdopterin-guanine dinucleotide biosynthesis protein [Arthrobacter sp. QXT-31]